MNYPYKSVKYRPDRWVILKKLAMRLSQERGTKVSIADATVEATKKMLDERDGTAATPGGQAQD